MNDECWLVIHWIVLAASIAGSALAFGVQAMLLALAFVLMIPNPIHVLVLDMIDWYEERKARRDQA